MQLPELLAPAGNFERLKTAFRYGADAVYVGLNAMSLRNLADNFTKDELKSACEMAHSMGKKVYVACNAFARDEDMDMLKAVIADAHESNADALIINDPGVFCVARSEGPSMPLHISTQANILNSEACKFWHEQGAERIILARELSLSQIKAMREKLPSSLELEIFVHGSMCISMSGRCLLSNYLSKRDCNKGECVQPCRWTYELRERHTNGEYMPVEQDERGTYILNSRDMNLIEYLPELIDTGVCSLKIEGRMKSVYYVATVVNAYRMALDELKRYCEENGSAQGFSVSREIVGELNLASHRPYTTGFAFGNPREGGEMTKSAQYVQDGELSAVVISYDEKEQIALIEQRNRFFKGDTLSILSPSDIKRSIQVTSMKNEAQEEVESAPHAQQRLYISCTERVKSGDILRKIS